MKIFFVVIIASIFIIHNARAQVTTGGQVPQFAGNVNSTYGANGLLNNLIPVIPLSAGGSTYGLDFTQSFVMPSVNQAGQTSLGFRNDLTISGDASKLNSGSGDILSGDFTTVFNNTGNWTNASQVTGGVQSGIYINGTGTYSATIRGVEVHMENNGASNTVSAIKGINFALTNNTGTIQNLYAVYVPDYSATPGGGSITSTYAFYSPSTVAKMLLASRADIASVNVTGNIGGVVYGWKLTGANTLAGFSNSVENLDLTASAFTLQSGITTVAFKGLPSSSAGTTGTLCWTTGTGVVNVDTTTTCLLSDENYKDIQSTISPTEGLRIVSEMQPLWFKYKPEYNKGNDVNLASEQPGFTAQRVAKVDRRLAAFRDDGSPKGVRYQEYVAVLTAAIQEIKADNDDLRARVMKLEAQR